MLSYKTLFPTLKEISRNLSTPHKGAPENIYPKKYSHPPLKEYLQVHCDQKINELANVWEDNFI